MGPEAKYLELFCRENLGKRRKIPAGSVIIGKLTKKRESKRKHVAKIVGIFKKMQGFCHKREIEV